MSGILRLLRRTYSFIYRASGLLNRGILLAYDLLHSVRTPTERHECAYCDCLHDPSVSTVGMSTASGVSHHSGCLRRCMFLSVSAPLRALNPM